MSKTATVTIDADENRVVWQVLVYENERCVEMRPFRDRQDAEEYAALFDKEKDEVYTMNERIRELVEESGLYIAYDNRNVTDKELESFAELIVRECLDIVGNNNPCPPGTTIMYSLLQDEYFDKGWQVAVEIKSNQIKKHFGVGE